MNELLIAISAALGLCVVVLVALLLLTRRAERRAEARVDDVVLRLEDRMDKVSQELGRALERAEAESRRSRSLGGIAGSIDLDEVLARTLEAARALPGTDAALVRIVTRIQSDEGAAEKEAADFVRTLYPILNSYLPG